MAATGDPLGVSSQTRYCSQCGHEVDGNFCSQCGTMVATTVTMPAIGGSQAPHGRGSRSRAPMIAGGVALALAAVVAAVIILAGGSGSSTASGSGGSYQQRLAAALNPMIAANQRLSGALAAIDGSQASLTAAGNAATDAQSAVASTRGAVGELTVPASQSTLSQQADQALTQDNGYLQAVGSTLSDPTGQAATQLQTLSTDTQSALVPINAIISNASGSVASTGNLLSWVQGAQQLTKKPSTQTLTSPTPQGGGVPPGSATPTGAGAEALDTSQCGASGVFVNSSTTSCGFAQNMKSNYFAAGNSGGEATVSAFSPATGDTYTFNCVPDTDGNVTCTGGVDASLTFAG
ncbi:MAG: zinc ribbon domain-containing protein [Solirubrobacteraceae bacterium]|jgi:hypothetical protein